MSPLLRLHAVAEKLKIATIDDYLATASPEAKPILEEIRRLIHLKVPNALEAISYQLPAFKHGRTFIYFAAFKKHIGVYPPVAGDKSLIEATARYRNDKGNLAFPLDQAIPFELIGKVAVALAKQYASKTET
jgi:uncharacterized protein YdhG (YjbR/CyaY superfamily)